MSNPSSDSYRNPLRYQGQDYSFAPRYYRPRDPLAPQNMSPDIKPKENQGYYPLASFWSNSTNGNLWVLTEIVNNLANWVLIGSAKGSLLTLSDNGNTVVFPSLSSATPPDNIQLTGSLIEQGNPAGYPTVVANASNHSISINPMSSSRWIVDPLGQNVPNTPNGTHTTISAALASAATGDTIVLMQGIHTEDVNLDLFLGTYLNIAGWTGDDIGDVTVVGKWTFTQPKTFGLSNIQFQTNGDFFLSITGGATSAVIFDGCSLNCTNHTGINFASSSSAAVISINYCTGNLGAAGIGIYTMSCPGTINIDSFFVGNNGGSSTASNNSAGIVAWAFSGLNSPLSSSGTGALYFNQSTNSTAAVGAIALTYNGTGPSLARYSALISGTASAISVGAGATLTAEYLVVNSSNVNAITGLGSIGYGLITFEGTSSTINTSTQVALVTAAGSITFSGGSNALSTYVTNTWIPNLQINGSSAGITYAVQVGGYTQIGNVVNFWLAITLTNKGASVGNITISNMPIATGANGAAQGGNMSNFGNITLANYTTFGYLLNTTSTVMSLTAAAQGQPNIFLAGTTFANNTNIQINGMYIVD